MEKKDKGVITIQKQRTVVITADNENEYQEKLKKVKLGKDNIEVKKIVGVIIPISIKNVP